ncbi:MAG: LamG domain-containing protein [Candidatus Nomurabacteria bacterium]|nr:LamG domain-containing protein [Candidatus Nomurabacteria bacterium]
MAVDDTYTKLLLHMDGANASTTFTDEAGKTITAVGNAQISTAQSKFGGASGLFDGTGDYLSVPDNDDWDFWGGDFTVDFWVYPTSAVGYHIIYWHGGTGGVSSSGYIYLYGNNTSNTIQFGAVNAGTAYFDLYPATYDISVNTWTHVAIVKSGTTIYCFINGVSKTPLYGTQLSGSMTTLTGDLHIGDRVSDGWSPFVGNIDEFRVSKGIARWTANFTPPTRAYEPVETDDSNTKFLLHCDGTNASTTFTDNATTPKTVTANGNAQLATAQKEFGTASGLFDGTGDYLSVPDSDDWAFGTGDFTIDFWFYLTTFNASQYVTFVSQGPDSNNFFQIQILENGATDNAYIAEVAGGVVLTTGGGSLGVNIAINTWYHFAVSRIGGDIRFFVNGVNNLTVTGVTGSFANHTGNFVVGRNDYNTTQYVYGYIDEFRVSKGVGRWFNNFAPPTVAYAGVVPSGPANLKTINGLVKASIKTINGVAIGSIKSINGLQ